MSRKIDHFIAELLQEDMLVLQKMKKVELFDFATKSLERNYRELCDDTIVELYEEKFHTYVR